MKEKKKKKLRNKKKKGNFMRNRKSMFREKNFKIYIQKKTIHLRSIFTTSQAKCAHVYSITVKQKSKKKKHFLSTFSFNK